MPAPVVAVIPFGAHAPDTRAGAWGRQLARRIVDRLADGDRIDLQPIFLVAVPERSDDTGYLVFGSTPDAPTAAGYGASIHAAWVLTGTYHESDAGRRLAVVLVDVAKKAPAATFDRAVPEGELHLAEPALTTWLLGAVGAPLIEADTLPCAGVESAYAALLEGMDEEVNATLLRQGDPAAAGEAIARALSKYLTAMRVDPTCIVAEEHLLVLAAESIERGEEASALPALEALLEYAPRSWRANYLMAQLRTSIGDHNGAVVAFEHSDALHPLGDADVIRLAELYASQDAPASAIARLRRIKPGSDAYAQAQETLALLQAQRGDLSLAITAFERAIAAGSRAGATYARLAQCYAATGDDVAAQDVLRRADREALPSWEISVARGARAQATGDARAAIDAYRAALASGAPVALRLDLGRTLIAAGERDAAVAELDALISAEPTGEIAGHARRLRLGTRDPELERSLEEAGRTAFEGTDDALPAARASLEKISTAEPDLWEAQFGLGLVARRTGDVDSAERAFGRVLELWPDQPDAHHQLGITLLAAERVNEALRHLEVAVRARPDDGALLADAGYAQLRAGNLTSARQLLERAQTIDKTDEVAGAYLEELERIEATVGGPRERALLRARGPLPPGTNERGLWRGRA